MKVFVAGATGVLGRRVIPRLIAEGHSVTGVSRSVNADRALATAGAIPSRIDLFDAPALRNAVSGHDVVINLATHIPPADTALKRKAWAENDRLRCSGSRNLAAAARASGTSVFVQESIALSYADSGDKWIDESATLAPAWNTVSALEAERNALALVDNDTKVIALRLATLYAPEANYTCFVARYLDRGFSPFVGHPDAYISMLHADDAASFICAAMGIPSGVYNVAEDEPLTRKELLRVLASQVHRKKLRTIPTWLARFFGGEVADLLMRSQRISNESLRKVSDWKPVFRSSRTGYPHALRVFRQSNHCR
jgi:nucleoside-diphosphate-sugar epimerase